MITVSEKDVGRRVRNTVTKDIGEIVAIRGCGCSEKCRKIKFEFFTGYCTEDLLDWADEDLL